MSRSANAILQLGVVSLILFTALVVVAVTDYVTEGDMSRETALVIAAACIAIGGALQITFLRRGGAGHGRA